MKVIETERLVLRTWKNEDADEYYRINQDQKVIEFLPASLTMEQVRDFINLMNQQFDQMGYTLWAAEEKSSDQLKQGLLSFCINRRLPYDSEYGTFLCL